MESIEKLIKTLNKWSIARYNVQCIKQFKEFDKISIWEICDFFEIDEKYCHSSFSILKEPLKSNNLKYIGFAMELYYSLLICINLNDNSISLMDEDLICLNICAIDEVHFIDAFSLFLEFEILRIDNKKKSTKEVISKAIQLSGTNDSYEYYRDLFRED